MLLVLDPIIEEKERLMIETYFARTSTIARLRSGPLGPDLDALARACASKGMHGTASDGICAAAINSHGGCVSTGTPSPNSRPHSSTGSCKQPLRIIHSTPQPATRSPFHQHAREHCHGTNPLFLPTRSRGAGVHLPEALLALAQRRHFPSAADRATLLWSSENGHTIKLPERCFRTHWD
jgi:hypothetical protein